VKLLWGILCSRIITDSQTNTVSYIDCIEEIKTPKLPVKLLSCSIGSLWEKTTEGADFLKARITTESPSGQIDRIGETENLEIAKDRHRLNFLLDGFPIKEVGNYSFKVEVLKFWDSSDIAIILIAPNQVDRVPRHPSPPKQDRVLR